jgi:hypothetical protein
MNKKLYFIPVGVVIAIYIYWGNKSTKETAHEHYNEFYNSDVIGVITKVGIGFKSTELRINDSKKRFYFNSVPVEPNDSKDFLYVAQKGDSVYKPAQSDTLVLIRRDQKHRNQRHLFTFRKY